MWTPISIFTELVSDPRDAADRPEEGVTAPADRQDELEAGVMKREHQV